MIDNNSTDTCADSACVAAVCAVQAVLYGMQLHTPVGIVFCKPRQALALMQSCPGLARAVSSGQELPQCAGSAQESVPGWDRLKKGADVER